MNESELNSFLNEIPLDIRAEVVIADIISFGYNPNELFIKPAGIFQRRFNKDILKAELVEFKNKESALFVETTREGIYDMLPQSLFHNHPVKGSNAFRSARNMVEEYRIRVKEEEDSRKYFLIYEIEFYRQRIAISLLEKNVTESIAYKMDDKEILSYWNLPDIFDNRQKGILFYLFPVFHKIRGSLNYMQEVYRLILNKDIKIERTTQSTLLNYEAPNLIVGEIILSYNSVLGNCFQSYYPAFEISILKLSDREISNYIPESKNLRIIEKLNQYFMPVFCETIIKFETERVEWSLNDNNSNSSRLGMSMYI